MKVAQLQRMGQKPRIRINSSPLGRGGNLYRGAPRLFYFGNEAPLSEAMAVIVTLNKEDW